MKKLLINLPEAFFNAELLKDRFDDIRRSYDVRTASHNTPEEIAKDLDWPDAIMMWAWPALGPAEFDIARNLKILAQINTCRATATNALARGVALSEARHAWSPSVAEMALALMLAGLRRTSDYHAKMRAGNDDGIWVNNFPTDIDPTERQLTGRTVGIIGFGGIGRRLAELLAPFHVELLVSDPFLPAETCAKFGAESADADEICRRCEVVVLCAANTPEAEKTLNARRIAALCPNAVLVNVGRSMLVDMDALARRLAQGDLIAMLDVFDREPLELDSPFRALSNAYLTPHRAGGIYESVYRSLDWLRADIDAFFAGGERKFAVTEGMAHCFAE